MARLPRLELVGYPHHATLRGHGGADVFLAANDYATFLIMLRDSARKHGLALHAYVLMPNHVHLIATPLITSALSRTIQSLGRLYVRAFNDRYRRRGTLWDGRFRSTVIEAETYLLVGICHIESNPVRSGLVVEPGEYPWSSFRHHVGDLIDPLLTDHESFWALGNTPFERQNAYRVLAAQTPRKELVERLRWATHRGWPTGGSGFLQRIRHESERPLIPRSKGRKRRSDSEGPTAGLPRA